ncbi:WYL domain-containing protein [Thomasclavelia cocleata]|jgi:predicted DNA-binding transcriptional regulator YafY|uniref:WYL domain-containing protein n=2 Tax=Thomasclavelia cocleata TaxID=69824 RepID=UPI00241EEC48|nr:WYL domain-containing protein [Thomasclavelia cocleata]MCI9132022.1 WYL domain-containing protein [Thomasclavelia cocleata]MCI9630814.1 WYL domain-containing protein [Thomasclavelia cocleata]
MGEKMYYIYKVINDSNQPIKGKEILVYLQQYGYDLNIKTIYSLIKRINDFYHCLTGKYLIKTIRRSGFVIEDEFFDDGQLQLLMDSIIFNPNLDKNSASIMVEKLSLLSSYKQIKRLNIEDGNNNILTYDPLISLTTIIKAVNNHKNIAFKYISYDIDDNCLVEVYHNNGNHDSETYIISPYKLILKGSNYYLIGYFNKRKNSLSVYRVDRMRLVRNHNSKFEEIREQFDMAKEFDKIVNMYISKKRIDLKIRFNQSVLKEVVNQFGKDIIVSKTYDGKIEAEIKNVALSDGLVGWLMMLQTNIQVILPLGLKEMIRKRLKLMLKMYEQETE